MKKVLLLTVAALMLSTAAFADYINVYVDAAGENCNLAPGFTQTATLVYKGWTPGGSTGARFKVVGPVGSSIFSLTTPYVTIGNVASDLSIAFGGCVPGTFSMGTLTAIWGVGTGGGVVASDGYPNIIMTDCNFGEYPAQGGTFCVGQASCGCTEPVATEQSTWGQVKALYR